MRGPGWLLYLRQHLQPSQGMPVLLRKVSFPKSENSHIFDVTSGYFCKIPADLCPKLPLGQAQGWPLTSAP